MKKNSLVVVLKSFIFFVTLFAAGTIVAQQQSIPSNQTNQFWDKVQFGGGIGLNFGSGYTDISLSPSAIYNVNQTVALGISLQGGYISSKNYYESYTYGGSLIGLINPIPQIQLSAELEQLRVNTNYDSSLYKSDNFWSTALYLGAGYRSGNVTIGARYDVLHNDAKSIYSEAFMPFVRVYF
ncbi:hypothetical protein [Flavobacterium restrictum]|uniref:Alpha-ketoglutarate decarboxylase n=1 Tax=Flavobacterium restrictum TaxID=2594428 RepID=A0A553DUA7_9FLAO|nr:hypothetical protein [Flavobacterium restrictum]TRX36356.1 hypothetical protein FNW21_13700 [Flavobacterium restrictum]